MRSGWVPDGNQVSFIHRILVWKTALNYANPADCRLAPHILQVWNGPGCVLVYASKSCNTTQWLTDKSEAKIIDRDSEKQAFKLVYLSFSWKSWFAVAARLRSSLHNDSDWGTTGVPLCRRCESSANTNGPRRCRIKAVWHAKRQLACSSTGSIFGSSCDLMGLSLCC